MSRNRRDVGIFYQNVRSLRTKCNDFSDSVLDDNFKMYCITETWLNGSILSHNPFPDSYWVYRADRNYSASNTKRGGGVLTAVYKPFREVKRRYDLETADECVWAEIPAHDN
jgi:hypothetical protein